MAIATTSSERKMNRVAHGRSEWLDALRGMAALTVLVGHCVCMLWAGLDEFYARIMNVGHAAVISFFVISGYVIPMSIERSDSLRVFWARRFWRLYPAYWATLAMTGGLLAVGRIYPRQGEPSLLMLPLDLFMIRGSVSLPFVAGAWTLWVELVFYGLVSLMWIVGLHKRPAAIAWILMFLSYGLRHYAPGMNWLTGGYYSWELLLFLAIMSVGTCLYRLDRGELRPLVAYGALAGLVLLLVRLILVSGGDPHAPALLAGLVAFLVARQLRHFEIPRPFLWLGRISYSLYLVHPVVMVSFGSVGPRPLTLLIWVGATLVLATLSYHFIEAPAERFGRYLTAPGGRRTAEVQFPPTLAIEAG